VAESARLSQDKDSAGESASRGQNEIELKPLSARPGLLISVAIAAAAVLIVGLFPQPYMTSATNAFAAAVGRQPLATVAETK